MKNSFSPSKKIISSNLISLFLLYLPLSLIFEKIFFSFSYSISLNCIFDFSVSISVLKNKDSLFLIKFILKFSKSSAKEYLPNILASNLFFL